MGSRGVKSALAMEHIKRKRERNPQTGKDVQICLWTPWVAVAPERSTRKGVTGVTEVLHGGQPSARGDRLPTAPTMVSGTERGLVIYFVGEIISISLGGIRAILS